MTRYIVTLLITIFILPVFGQEKYLQYPEASTTTDSIAIMDLIKKAGELQLKNPDSTIYLAGMAFEKGKQSGYNEASGRALALIGVGYRNKGKAEESIRYFKMAIPYLKRQKKDSNYYLAGLNNVMFGSYFALGYYDSAAIKCYEVINLYNQYGVKKINPPDAFVNPLIDAYQHLGLCWFKLGFYQKALSYLVKAEGLSRADRNNYQLLSVLNNKANVYLHSRKPDSASVLIQEARKLAIAQHDSAMLVTVQLNMAIAYQQANSSEQATKTLEHLLTQDTFAIKPETKVLASYILAESYIELKKYPEAMRLIDRAEAAAADRSLGYLNTQPYFLRAAVYDGQGNYKLAYQQLKKANQLLDSMVNNDKIQALNILDVSLQTAEKDKQITAGSLALNQQYLSIKKRNTWLGATVAVAILLLIFLAAIYRINKHKRRLQEEQISSLSKQNEIVQLKAMMKGELQERSRLARELHDGFIGQLSAIKMNFSALAGQPADVKYDENMLLLEETIQDLRHTAHNLMPEILLHGSLEQALQLYCARMSKVHHIDINFEVVGGLPRLNAEFELTLYRMIQEALQNVVKHSGASQALVQISYYEGMISFTVEDNGSGLDKNDKQKKESLGIENLKARVGAWNGFINISGKPGEGTTIYVEFEIKDGTNISGHE